MASCMYMFSVKYDNVHLNAALHDYDTLHVNQIKHTPSTNSKATHHHVSFSALGQSFHMVLHWDRHILAKDFAVYTVDSQGNKYRQNIDQKAFLHGHLQSKHK